MVSMGNRLIILKAALQNFVNIGCICKKVIHSMEAIMGHFLLVGVKTKDK